MLGVRSSLTRLSTEDETCYITKPLALETGRITISSRLCNRILPLRQRLCDKNVRKSELTDEVDEQAEHVVEGEEVGAQLVLGVGGVGTEAGMMRYHRQPVQHGRLVGTRRPAQPCHPITPPLNSLLTALAHSDTLKSTQTPPAH